MDVIKTGFNFNNSLKYCNMFFNFFLYDNMLTKID